MYRLIHATADDKNLLIKWKLSTIFEHADNLDDKENEKINNYVNENVNKLLNDYKIILVDDNKVGCFLVVNYEDGVMLDEVYLEETYRRKGIGTDLIKKMLDKHDVVYLWVYKKNEMAIRLYKSLGFFIESETETRYFMKYKNRNDRK